jgi:hypothetical protein
MHHMRGTAFMPATAVTLLLIASREVSGQAPRVARAYVDPELHEWLFRQRRATAAAR